MAASGQEFQDTVEKGRIFRDVIAFDSLIRFTGTGKEGPDIKSRKGSDDESYFGKDAEPATDAAAFPFLLHGDR